MERYKQIEEQRAAQAKEFKELSEQIDAQRRLVTSHRAAQAKKFEELSEQIAAQRRLVAAQAKQ